jgi:hypothetical protein
MTSTEKATTLAKIMQLLELLPFHSCALEDNIPPNGIYLFFEKGPDGLWQVTRIGTHRKDKGLTRRLIDHYFADKNNSVFRKHLGTALLRRKSAIASSIEQWTQQGTPTIWEVESEVTNLLRRDFQFKCLKVDDRDKRELLEQELIALFSGSSRPLDTWLGRDAHDERIVGSGLWNIEHVGDQWNEDNEMFLETVHELVQNTQDHYRCVPHITGVDPSAFESVNRRIAECQRTSLVLDCLSDLHSETRDPYVALCLARELSKRKSVDKAIKYYRVSLDACSQGHHLPYPRYRNQAQVELDQLVQQGDRREAINRGATPLIVVSCTFPKKWQKDQSFDAPKEAYDETEKAYTGRGFLEWEKDKQEGWLKKISWQWVVLSGKYGFIEPTHPIEFYDCTFSDPETGPISRGSLRAQALYQSRLLCSSDGKWRHIPLSSFDLVVCHRSCSPLYTKLVKFAFGPERILQWEQFKQMHHKV